LLDPILLTPASLPPSISFDFTSKFAINIGKIAVPSMLTQAETLYDYVIKIQNNFLPGDAGMTAPV
jgi:hypothetical protein